MYLLTSETEHTGVRGRPRVWYTFDGKTMTGTEWASYLHVRTAVFYQRLKKHRTNPTQHPLAFVFKEHFK